MPIFITCDSELVRLIVRHIPCYAYMNPLLGRNATNVLLCSLRFGLSLNDNCTSPIHFDVFDACSRSQLNDDVIVNAQLALEVIMVIFAVYVYPQRINCYFICICHSRYLVILVYTHIVLFCMCSFPFFPLCAPLCTYYIIKIFQIIIDRKSVRSLDWRRHFQTATPPSDWIKHIAM
jgi:hypothetical protein